MSNLLFRNLDRLKTIARFLVYDNTVSLNQYHGKLETLFKYRGKFYKIKTVLTEVQS